MESRNDKERAKQIILEIIRQAGGEFHNKTNLYKAFWKAHLLYAERHGRHLSGWPIVRMPKGPGIDRFTALLAELLLEKAVDVEEVQKGPFQGFIFRLTGDAKSSQLDLEAIKIIDAATADVVTKSAAQVSDESHKQSRAWNLARDGEEMDVYLDLMSEEEFDVARSRAEALMPTVVELWGSH